MKIDLEKVEKANISIETVLALIYADYKDNYKVYPGDVPEASLFADLLEDNYITGSLFNLSLTRKGRILLNKCLYSDDIKYTKNHADFIKFWNEVPTSDRHGNFPKTRTIKTNRPGAELAFWKVIKQGEYTAEQLTLAMRTQTEEMKKGSVGSRNQLKFMKAPSTWLNQQEYEGILADLEDTKDDPESWTEEMV